jgi:hypothetical protein
VPRFRRFLGGPTGRFLRAEEGRHAGQAVRCEPPRSLESFKRGHCLAPFCPPIAKLKNVSFAAAEKKKENEKKIRKNKKFKIRNNFVA